MNLKKTSRPTWLTFDCYGTLIQWDEGLHAAAEKILAQHGKSGISAHDLIEVYDRHEHRLEQALPYRSFREVAGEGLKLAMTELGLPAGESSMETLTESISAMPPFPEVVPALRALKDAGFKLCIVSNTDDDIIAGNVAQLGGCIDRVISAQQARAYKPSAAIFEHAYRTLDISKDDVVHICASPHLDHAAAREIGFRCIWIDRGTGRTVLPDYTPDATVGTLDEVLEVFRECGWMADLKTDPLVIKPVNTPT
jgi:2-haloacid dehalogenase